MLTRTLSLAELTGQQATHVVQHPEFSSSLRLQAPVWQAFIAMQTAARTDGIELALASTFRDFDRQLAIWNRKYLGQAPLYNEHGDRLLAEQLSCGEKVAAIMTWSALPGASRHHWGTDCDIYDPRWFAQNQQPLQLIAAEYQHGGPCYDAALWLRQHATDFGFHLPYARYQGGVAAEPWHLSYTELAEPAAAHLSTELLHQVLAASDLAGKEFVLAQLAELKQRYVDQVCRSDDTGDAVWFG
jgi:LAS superfamily LD-carboxypeptidase LdcB